jgi:NADH:ubiquinone oxidoreductase subunit 5 (subunit L)/multisubunit Na+/H+ antiporter MnhA subunit
MIKFFRKIRQNLLLEGKTGKYLKYAIGEILLVIIGILIAVSINNWNEDRKLEKVEQSILKDLKQEMTINLKALELVIEGNERSFQGAEEIRALFLDREAFDKISDTTFLRLIRKMNWNVTYDPQNGILNSIISSGQINQLSNKGLKYLLASLKEMTTDALENSMNIETRRVDLMRSAWINAMFIADEKNVGYDVKSFYEHPEFIYATNNLFYHQRKDGLEEEKN